MSLDYSTIHFCNALLNANYGAMFLVLWLRRRELHLLFWAESFLIVAGAGFGFTLTADPLLIAALFGVVSANVSFIWAGARAFDGKPAFDLRMLAVPLAVFACHVAARLFGGAAIANAATTALLSVNVLLAGLHLLRHGRSPSGLGRPVAGWALIAYVPLYVGAALVAVLLPEHRLSAVAILVGDLLLNNAFAAGLFAMMEERARAELRRLATTDPLTGALNRAGLMARCGAMEGMAVLIADLDHFKQINDRFGHAAGDAALTGLVERIKTVLQADECVARLGGEEFVIMLSTSSQIVAAGRAEILRRIVADHPIRFEAQAIDLTVSIGLAQRQADETLEATIARADLALYRAKTGGRNRVAA